MTKHLDHKEKKYGIRFGFYFHETDDAEANERRFDHPVQAPKFLNFELESGTYLSNLPRVLMTLYVCKSLVNAFVRAGLPSLLRDADAMQLIKFSIMTDKISIDMDGQLAVNWHNGELFIEIVELYEVTNHETEQVEYKVKKTLARHEALVRPLDNDVYPVSEMTENA